MYNFIIPLLVILIIFLICINCKKIDYFTDIPQSDIIDIYQMDLPAIKNMISIASALNDDTQLKIPTNLLVDGPINTKSDLNINGFISSLGDISCNIITANKIINSNTATQKNLNINCTNKLIGDTININGTVNAANINVDNLSGETIYANNDYEDLETKCNNIIEKYKKIDTNLKKLMSLDTLNAPIRIIKISDLSNNITINSDINVKKLTSMDITNKKSNLNNITSDIAKVGDYYIYNPKDKNTLIIGQESEYNKTNMIDTFKLNTQSDNPLTLRLPAYNYTDARDIQIPSNSGSLSLLNTTSTDMYNFKDSFDKNNKLI